MEYSTNDGNTWTDYDENNIPVLAGNDTVLVRAKATEHAFPGDIVTMTLSYKVSEDSETQKPKEVYKAHMKLGLVGKSTYAYELAKLLRDTYNARNVLVTREDSNYRVSADFINKAAAVKSCKEMKAQKYIINYYIE